MSVTIYRPDWRIQAPILLVALALAGGAAWAMAAFRLEIALCLIAQSMFLVAVTVWSLRTAITFDPEGGTMRVGWRTVPLGRIRALGMDDGPVGGQPTEVLLHGEGQRVLARLPLWRFATADAAAILARLAILGARRDDPRP
jgi:hypothetical protein